MISRTADIQRQRRLPLADIVHHQQVLTLIFFVRHQPRRLLTCLLRIRIAGDGPGQGFGIQPAAVTVVKPLRTGSQKGLMRRPGQEVMETPVVNLPARRHQRQRQGGLSTLSAEHRASTTFSSPPWQNCASAC